MSLIGMIWRVQPWRVARWRPGTASEAVKLQRPAGGYRVQSLREGHDRHSGVIHVDCCQSTAARPQFNPVNHVIRNGLGKHRILRQRFTGLRLRNDPRWEEPRAFPVDFAAAVPQCDHRTTFSAQPTAAAIPHKFTPETQWAVGRSWATGEGSFCAFRRAECGI